VHHLLVGVLAAASVAAVAAAVLGFVLAEAYDPLAPGSAWRDWHLVATLVLLVTSGAAAVGGVMRRSVLVPACAATAAAAAVATLLTRPLVGTSEVSKGVYAVALAVHLGAPLLAAASLLVATALVARSARTAQPADVPVAPAVA
jgi:hypothetical protein